MDPIYTDTLKTLMVYKYELEAAVVELERISHHNTILYCIIAALIASSNMRRTFLCWPMR